MSSNANRLAEAVKSRRAELDLTQMDVWQSGGPSNTTLTTIEGGNLPDLTRVTARKLDAGLRWEPGTARRVWEGVAVPSDEPDLARAVAEIQATDLRPKTKTYIIDALRRDHERHATEQGERRAGA